MTHAPNCATKHNVQFCTCGALNRWIARQTPKPPPPAKAA